jgi:hypothetical protein
MIGVISIDAVRAAQRAAYETCDALMLAAVGAAERRYPHHVTRQLLALSTRALQLWEDLDTMLGSGLLTPPAEPPRSDL